jgi:hypothetical protein
MQPINAKPAEKADDVFKKLQPALESAVMVTLILYFFINSCYLKSGVTLIYLSESSSGLELTQNAGIPHPKVFGSEGI